MEYENRSCLHYEEYYMGAMICEITSLTLGRLLRHFTPALYSDPIDFDQFHIGVYQMGEE